MQNDTKATYCEGMLVRVVRSEIFPGTIGAVGVVEKASPDDAGRVPVNVGPLSLYYKPGDLVVVREP